MLNTRLASVLTAATLAILHAAPAEAHVECGDPRGPARNVTATRVKCGDARSFARKIATRHVTVSGPVSLPGWRTYHARVRRVRGEYDLRATRGTKVIRFQYRATGGGGGRGCDPNYAGACLRPDAGDYDCAGGSGDGPYYTGYVEVVGLDHYDLDRDRDGVACEG